MRGSSQHSSTYSIHHGGLLFLLDHRGKKAKEATAVSYSAGQGRRVDEILAAVQVQGPMWRV